MKERAKSGDEQDWVRKCWRRVLCVFGNRSGLGKKVKRALNKRGRRRAREEALDELAEQDQDLDMGY